MDENPYTILDVDEKASQDEIKKKYRKLSLKYHPDKNMGNSEAEEKFKIINGAYEIIGNEQKRREYDMQKNSPFQRGAFNTNAMNGPGGMDDIMKMFFNGHGLNMGGGMGGNVKIFRNGQPVNMEAMNKPQPIIKTIVITLEQSYFGCQLPVQIERWIMVDNIRKMENETLYISIPKGIDNKEMLVLKEKGNCLSDSLKGDIKLVFSITNDSLYKREGLNLFLEKTISFKESICGFEFIIKHINGKQLKYSNEAGQIINHGHIKTIPNYGMERDSYKGNLCIKLNIDYSKKLSKDQINELNKIL
tara:strand:+ start:146 stop:1057 length:912 start_codon:yes stop_codon:yes gene_type:complete